jgi:hypothetical protein
VTVFYLKQFLTQALRLRSVKQLELRCVGAGLGDVRALPPCLRALPPCLRALPAAPTPAAVAAAAAAVTGLRVAGDPCRRTCRWRTYDARTGVAMQITCVLSSMMMTCVWFCAATPVLYYRDHGAPPSRTMPVPTRPPELERNVRTHSAVLRRGRTQEAIELEYHTK